jgi:hypothetical protein
VVGEDFDHLSTALEIFVESFQHVGAIDAPPMGFRKGQKWPKAMWNLLKEPIRTDSKSAHVILPETESVHTRAVIAEAVDLLNLARA